MYYLCCTKADCGQAALNTLRCSSAVVVVVGVPLRSSFTWQNCFNGTTLYISDARFFRDIHAHSMSVQLTYSRAATPTLWEEHMLTIRVVKVTLKKQLNFSCRYMTWKVSELQLHLQRKNTLIQLVTSVKILIRITITCAFEIRCTPLLGATQCAESCTVTNQTRGNREKCYH